MATLHGSNIVTDGSAELDFLNKVLNFLEEKDHLKDRTEAARMRRLIANHIGDGKDAVYKLVDKKLLKLYEQELKKKDIPFTVIYDSLMNPAIVVRDIDKEEFLDIQKNIFALDARANAQLEISDFCKVCESMRINKMVKLTFDNEIDLAEAQNKAYSMGFVTTRKDNSLFIQPRDVFNEHEEDLISFEMSWALNQSMNDALFGGTDKEDSKFQKLRSAQAEYDLNQIKGFANALQGKGEPVLMVDASGKGKNALEINDRGFCVHRMDASGRIKMEVLATKDDLLSMTPQQIGALVSKQGFEIRNKVLIPTEHRNKVLGGKASEIKSFIDKYCNDNGLQKRPIGIEYGFDKRDEKLLMTKKTILEPVLKNVLHEARKMAIEAGDIKNDIRHCIQNEEIIKRYAALILRDKKNENLQRFLQSKDIPLSDQEKEAWLDDIADHLENSSETCRHECKVEIVNVKDTMKEINREKKAKQEAEKQSEKGKEENKAKEDSEKTDD